MRPSVFVFALAVLTLLAPAASAATMTLVDETIAIEPQRNPSPPWDAGEVGTDGGFSGDNYLRFQMPGGGSDGIGQMLAYLEVDNPIDIATLDPENSSVEFSYRVNDPSNGVVTMNVGLSYFFWGTRPDPSTFPNPTQADWGSLLRGTIQLPNTGGEWEKATIEFDEFFQDPSIADRSTLSWIVFNSSWEGTGSTVDIDAVTFNVVGTAVVPEPTTMVLFAVAGAAVLMRRRHG